jgi:hypothetical protein
MLEAAPVARRLTHSPYARTAESRAIAVALNRFGRAEPQCFQSCERLLCGERQCAYRAECLRLVAAWKR